MAESEFQTCTVCRRMVDSAAHDTVYAIEVVKLDTPRGRRYVDGSEVAFHESCLPDDIAALSARLARLTICGPAGATGGDRPRGRRRRHAADPRSLRGEDLRISGRLTRGTLAGKCYTPSRDERGLRRRRSGATQGPGSGCLEPFPAFFSRALAACTSISAGRAQERTPSHHRAQHAAEVSAGDAKNAALTKRERRSFAANRWVTQAIFEECFRVPQCPSVLLSCIAGFRMNSGIRLR